MSAPSQIIVIVSKEKTDKDMLYSYINLNAFDYASIHGSTVGVFKLWCYLVKNQHGYSFELSRTAFFAWSGLSASAYHNVIKFLKEQRLLSLV